MARDIVCLLEDILRRAIFGVDKRFRLDVAIG